MHAMSRRPATAGQLQASAGSARSMQDGGGELDPAKLLEQIRQQQQDVGWAAQIASSFAPKSSTEEFKLNWVGNIDRHQRKLFWRLITMLCDRIDPYLRWMRIAHDIIQGAKARGLAMFAFAMQTAWPMMLATGRALARQAFVLAREAAVLARLLLLRVGAIIGKGALSLVGVGVAVPPRTAEHAAKSSIGPTAGPWQRRLEAWVGLRGISEARADKSYTAADIVQPLSMSAAASPSLQSEVPQLANALLQDPETDSGVFPSGKPAAAAGATRRSSAASGVSGSETRNAREAPGSELSGLRCTDLPSVEGEQSKGLHRPLGGGFRRMARDMLTTIRSVDIII